MAQALLNLCTVCKKCNGLHAAFMSKIAFERNAEFHTYIQQK